MTRPIHDWHDAHDAVRSATASCLDALPADERKVHSSLLSSIDGSTREMEEALPCTLGGAALEERARLYERAVNAIVYGPERDARLLFVSHEDRSYIKSTDEVKGCVDMVARAFGIPRHAVASDVAMLSARRLGGDD